MARKPLTVNAGQLEQLDSGTALDVGGWNLPTAGGTLGYILTADASGHAIWAEASSDFGDPTVDDQVLISTAAGAASWSTAGNDQFLASDGSGEVAWENKPFGYDIPSPTVTDTMLVSTGAGAASWATEISEFQIGDVIFQNGNEIDCYNGVTPETISFISDCQFSQSLFLTGAVNRSVPESVSSGDDAGYLFNGHKYQGFNDQVGTLKITLPTSWANMSSTMKIIGYDRSTGGWELLVSGYADNATNAWLSTGADLIGSAPFNQVRLAYDGEDVCILLGGTSTSWGDPYIGVDKNLIGMSQMNDLRAAWGFDFITNEAGITDIVNVPFAKDTFGHTLASPTVDDQVLISTAAGAASWSTAGNDQYLASDGSGEVAWTSIPAGLSAPTADDQLLASTGVGTSAWTDTLDILKVDNLTLDGAAITSSTGAISFGDENLSTSGKMSVGSEDTVYTHSVVEIAGPSGANKVGSLLNIRTENELYGLFLGSWGLSNGLIQAGCHYNTSWNFIARDTSANVIALDSSSGIRFLCDTGLTPGTPYAATERFKITTVGVDVTGAVTCDDLTVDNININGAVVTSDTGAISFSNENLTTTGTVVGSNIPSPTVDDQVLIATASGVASWSTAGNNQVLQSDGSGNAAWANKPFGYNMASPASAGQIYRATGSGTASWTTDLTGLTNLTVDNININGAAITSDTGAISFSDENLTTTGLVTANRFTAVDSTSGNYSYKTVLQHNSGTSSDEGTMKILLPNDWAHGMLTIRIRGFDYTVGGAWEVLLGGYPYPNTTQWLTYGASLRGSHIPFDSVRLARDTSASKVCILLGTTSTVWRYPQVEIDLTVGFSNQDAWGGEWSISIIDSEAGLTNFKTCDLSRDVECQTTANKVLVSNTDKTFSWTTDLTGLTNLTVDNININGAVITSDTGAISFSNENLSTSGTVVGSNIPSPTVDDQVLIATASGVASWSTAGNNQVLQSDGSGNAAWANKPFGYNMASPASAGEIYRATGSGTASWTTDLTGLTNLTVDNININGAVITSDTGAISFSNENLTTTGLVTAHRFTAVDSISGNHSYKTVLQYNGQSSPDVGTMQILLPLDWAQGFLTIRIRGYNYAAGGGAWEVLFGGYPYPNSTQWLQYGASLRGADIPFDSVRLARDTSSSKVCILLGDTSTIWRYPQVEIDMSVGFSNQDSWGGEWSISVLTSEAGLTDLKTCDLSRDVECQTTANKVLVSNADKTFSWTTDLTGLTNLTVDNININGAVITSNTGAIGFSNENLSTTGTVVGSNIPSPTALDKALVSTASGIASWYTTCLADVLKITTPSASGAERKYVLTADSGAKFAIESAPWPLTLTANETIYVRTTGNDTIGDGSPGSPFLTLERTIEYLGGLYIGDYTVTVDIGEGVFTEAGTISFMHPFGAQVTFQGVSERIDGLTTASISGTTSYGFSNLYYRDVTMVLPVGKSVTVGDYIGFANASGGTNPNAVIGMHKVSNWVGGSRTATVQVAYRNGSETPSGTITCDVDLIKTVISFSDRNGLKITGPYFGGIWRGLVIQGDYNGSNDAEHGIWSLNGAVISISGTDDSGYACGIVGFNKAIYAQNNALIFADYGYMSKSGQHNCKAQNGGILNLRNSRINACSNYGIYAFNGSTVAANSCKVVGTGNNSVVSYQGSFIDLQSAFVGESNSTTSVYADRWSGIDGTGATVDDAISPATDGDNDGSYVIGL